MKIAFYIEDGREQIVLTPQTEIEKQMLGKLHDGGRVHSILRGEFYSCRGGWTRHGTNEESTIIVLRPATAGNAIANEPSPEEKVRPPRTYWPSLDKVAASGIETEGQDAAERLGAEHESPVGEAETPND
jgi:hypothetical protein